jgi:nucleoside diphosphate kinase
VRALFCDQGRARPPASAVLSRGAVLTWSAIITAHRRRAVFPREVAFVLLKPDVEAASARKDITSALEAHGFLILVERSETLSAERARALLPHASPADLAFLASGLSCLLAVEKPFAIGELVALCGPADSRAAREAAPSSLRAVFGTDLVKNAIAVSASADEAAAQLAHAFGARAFAGAGVAERSVALLLPDATSDGKEPLALAALRARGFMVISSKEVMLSPADAQLFMPDADPTLVQYTASGKSTAICVSRAHAARALVSLVGPAGSAKPSMLSNALGAFDASTPAAACPPTAASAAALAALFPELLEMQTTLAIIKPDALAAGHADKIVARIEEAGFTVRARTSLTLPAFKAAEFYAEHKGKPFAANLCAFMSSGPCVALALCRPGAIAEWRALMGATATAKARETTAGSLRALYGTDGTRNATHGSDSEQSARRELKFFFPALSVDAQPTADEVASAVREQLEPSLIAALTALCKAKPEDPVRWLGAYLLAHNPNKPKVAQLLAPAPHPKLPTKKIVPDIKVRAATRPSRRARARARRGPSARARPPPTLAPPIRAPAAPLRRFPSAPAAGGAGRRGAARLL